MQKYIVGDPIIFKGKAGLISVVIDRPIFEEPHAYCIKLSCTPELDRIFVFESEIKFDTIAVMKRFKGE